MQFWGVQIGGGAGPVHWTHCIGGGGGGGIWGIQGWEPHIVLIGRQAAGLQFIGLGWLHWTGVHIGLGGGHDTGLHPCIGIWEHWAGVQIGDETWDWGGPQHFRGQLFIHVVMQIGAHSPELGGGEGAIAGIPGGPGGPGGPMGPVIKTADELVGDAIPPPFVQHCRLHCG